ncbi:hypothetical protein CFP66_32855 [Pseudonocardia sp. MH-G8]|nr:hypothetical protein CFP66_32855 [Pseudonocardia sp. MH-G8]
MVFLAVARCGSFTAAAAELLLATPSVSARMTSLEQKVSSELFVRTRRGSTLTPAGERFLAYARRCLELLHDAHDAVRAPERRRLVVAAPASLGLVVFPAVLDVLSAAALNAHTRVSHSSEVIGQLLDGTADVGLLLSRMARPGVIVRRLLRSNIVTVAHPDNPLAGRRAVAVTDLLDSAVAVYRWNVEAEVLAETFAHPRRPSDRPVHFVGLPSVALDMLDHHGYVAIVPAFAAADALRAGRVVELPLALPGWALEVQLAHRADAAESAGVRALLASESRIVAALTAGQSGADG